MVIPIPWFCFPVVGTVSNIPCESMYKTIKCENYLYHKAHSPGLATN